MGGLWPDEGGVWVRRGRAASPGWRAWGRGSSFAASSGWIPAGRSSVRSAGPVESAADQVGVGDILRTMVRAWVASVTVLVCSGCGTQETYSCSHASMCVLGQVAGACQATGYCSFPDGECESGLRYGEFAGAGLDGQCVPSGVGDGASTREGTTSGNGAEDSGDPTVESPTSSATSEDSGPIVTGADITTDGGSSSATGEVPLEGVGCDMPVACDKGVFDGSLTITTPADVQEIAGYTEITGRLAIANSEVECLNFLSCLTSVGHDLNIFDNDALVDVSGLDNVTAIGAAVDGTLVPGGTLTISENDALVDFDSLNQVAVTPMSLSISENDSLGAISGFQGFVGTQENFEIRFNESLSSVSSRGLRGILFIGGECVVTNNANLCISTIEDMCSVGVKQGPFGGSTANNNEGC